MLEVLIKNNIKITILLATYNRVHLITETLDSIVAQTYNNWECIIVDDGSTDTTCDVVKNYVNKDSRFSYYLKTNDYKKGLAGTRNYGLDLAEKSNAQYIQFFDDDDLMNPRKLELQIAPLIKKPNLNFTVCKYEKIIEINGKFSTLKPALKLSFLHLGDAILTGEMKMNSLGPLWRKSFINQFRFDEDLKYAEEWELYTRIGYQFPSNYEVLDEYLFQYRKHENSLTLGKDTNYERRKSSTVIRIKIYEHLAEKKLHTQASILFLAKTFLLYYYQPVYVKGLINYVETNKGFSKKIMWFLNTGLVIGKFYRKVISKLANWV